MRGIAWVIVRDPDKRSEAWRFSGNGHQHDLSPNLTFGDDRKVLQVPRHEDVLVTSSLFQSFNRLLAHNGAKEVLPPCEARGLAFDRPASPRN